MFSKFLAAASLAGLVVGQELKLAKSYTGWDCCKPVCSTGNFDTSLIESRGMVRVCDRDNNPMQLQQGLQAISGCNAAAGTGFLCGNFSPVPVSENLAYGFAIEIGAPNTGNNPNCCKCYEIEWLTGEAADLGRKMIVQIITPGGSAGDVKDGDIIIMAPGGGVGPFGDAGCRRQYGNSYDWGEDLGGVTSREGCENLPPNLQGGCYWRYNWAGGEVNGWDIVKKQVECPARLTDMSGCNTRPAN